MRRNNGTHHSSWIVALSLVSYMIEATKGSVYCNFPEYLWRPLPDGGERKWLNRAIYEGNFEIWTRRKEIVVLHNEIIASIVSRVPCSEPPNSTAPPGVCERTKVLYKYRCLAEESVGKFRVIIKQEKKDEFICVKLIRRDTHVVQLWTARRSEVNEGSLCHDDNLKRDPWPWLSSQLDDWQPLPFTGGFDFSAHMEGSRKKKCRKQWRPSRLESDCVLGEGIRFFFPDERCSIFQNGHLDKQLQSWGSWKEEAYLFVILSRDSHTPQYTLRLPKATDIQTDFVGEIYYSPLSPLKGNGRPPPNVLFVKLNMHRSDNGDCYDESSKCSLFARDGRCTGREQNTIANHCKKSCGLCGRSSHVVPSARAACHFPPDYLGHWIVYDTTSSQDVTIGAGQLTFSLLGNFVCKNKHYEKNHYKLLSLSQNGCRPRYTCAHFRRDRGCVLLYHLSTSSLVDHSFDLCQFEDDAAPLGGRFRSKALKVLLPQEDTQFDSCGLDGSVVVQATLGRGSLSDLSPASGCQPKPELSLSPDLWKESETLVWQCASYVRLQEGRSVLTTKRDGDSKYRCWLVFTDNENRWKKAYLLNRSQCGTKKDFDAASEIMENTVLTVDVVRYTASCGHRKQTYDTTTAKQVARTTMYEARTHRMIHMASTPSTSTISDVVIMTIDSHDNYQRRSGGSEPNIPQITVPGGATVCSPTILAEMLMLCLVFVLVS